MEAEEIKKLDEILAKLKEMEAKQPIIIQYPPVQYIPYPSIQPYYPYHPPYYYGTWCGQNMQQQIPMNQISAGGNI